MISENSRVRLRRPVVSMAFVGQSTIHGLVAPCYLMGSVSSNTLTVASITQGVVEIGATLLTPGGEATVLAQLTGTAGSTGTYTLTPIANASSQAMTAIVKRAHASLRKPWLMPPLPGAQTLFGGPLFRVIDDMWDWGYDLRIANTAKSGMSLIRDGVGQVASWAANSSGFFARRAPWQSPDRGDLGSIIVESNKVFRCMSGNIRVAMNAPPFSATGAATNGNGTPGQVIVDTLGTFGPRANGTSVVPALVTTAASKPAGFATAAVGDTVTDGGYTWICESTNAVAYLSNGPLGASGGIFTGAYFAETARGGAWDPLGILDEVLSQLNSLAGEEADRYVYIDGNQGDIGATAATRSGAVQNAAIYSLSRGIKVIIGNTMYSPGSGAIGGFQTQNTGNAAAIAALQASQYAGRVFTGADLYTTFGTDPVGSGYMQSDQIHPTGLASANLQGPAISTSLKAIFPQLVA